MACLTIVFWIISDYGTPEIYRLCDWHNEFRDSIAKKKGMLIAKNCDWAEAAMGSFYHSHFFARRSKSYCSSAKWVLYDHFDLV